MQRIKLSPRSHAALKYTVPRGRTIEYEVESEEKKRVSTYIVDSAGLRQFRNKETVDSYGGFNNRRYHYEICKLPFLGTWYLLIANDSPMTVEIMYEVLF